MYATVAMETASTDNPLSEENQYPVQYTSRTTVLPQYYLCMHLSALYLHAPYMYVFIYLFLLNS